MKSSKINFYTSDDVWDRVVDFKQKHQLKNNTEALEELIKQSDEKSGGEEKSFKAEKIDVKVDQETVEQIRDFYNNLPLLEKKLNVPLIIHKDRKAGAVFTTCSMEGNELIKLIDLDAVIDPVNQEAYRENRELQPSNNDFKQMIEDAKEARTFTDIVIEYVPRLHRESYRSEVPLKVLGGQHRCDAIQKAVNNGKGNIPQGLRVYFNLDLDKRAEIALISNTNIAVSPDLRDRVEEHRSGEGKLREWCWEIGLLPKGKDFVDKRSAESTLPTVRMARTLIVNFYDGKNYAGDIEKDLIYSTICKTGGADPDYSEILKKLTSFKEETELVEFGKAFGLLHKKQIKKIKEKPNLRASARREYQNKALSLAVLSSYAYAAGLLQKFPKRLKKLCSLADSAQDFDPLNVDVLSDARHEDFDPEAYRGLGTRTEAKERGRLTQLFLLYSKAKQKTIDDNLCRAAIDLYHAKDAATKARKSEAKVI
jgi:hypothetical protein